MKRIIRAFLILALIFATLSFSACDKNQDDGSVTAIILSSSNVVFDDLVDDDGKPLTQTITARVVPADAIDAEITWSSSDSSVASCEDGVITANNYGVALIRATAKNGITAACSVTIGEQNPSLKISKLEVKLKSIGAKEKIVAYTVAENLPAAGVTWSSSNESVARCENGEIISVGYGVCMVKARSKTGKEAECVVVVENENEPHCDISKTELILSDPGTEHTLAAAVSNDPQMNVSWYSSNANVATVDGGVVRAVDNGKCVIIAVAENGLTAACAVTVGEVETPTTGIEESVKFEIPAVPSVVKYVNQETNQIESMAMINSYTIQTVENAEGIAENEIGLIVTINYTKIYDINGESGKAPVVFMANVFRDNGVFCYKEAHVGRDATFGQEYSSTMKMKITLYKDVQRYFYVVIPEYIVTHI